jgi:hypothetical protein
VLRRTWNEWPKNARAWLPEAKLTGAGPRRNHAGNSSTDSRPEAHCALQQNLLKKRADSGEPRVTACRGSPCETPVLVRPEHRFYSDYYLSGNWAGFAHD